MSEPGSPEDLKREEGKLASSLEELPELKKDYVRVVHITTPDNALKIVKSGLNYEKYGMLSSTARSYADPDRVEYFSDDPRFSSPLKKVVVMDIPREEHRLHESVTKSPGVVPSKYVVGIINPVRKYLFIYLFIPPSPYWNFS